MPAGKRQSNAMLYTLIVFVALFIIATTAAIIYYVKTEELKSVAADAERKLQDVITDAEYRNLGDIVGKKQPRKSRLATMVDYLDQTLKLISSSLSKEQSADNKVKDAQGKTEDAYTEFKKSLNELENAGHIDMNNRDPNTTGLVQIVGILNTKLDTTGGELENAEKQKEELQGRFDDAVQEAFEKEQNLLAEKDKLQMQVNDIKNDYDDLKKLMKQTTDQQIHSLMSDLENQRTDYRRERQEKLKTQAELKRTKSRMEGVLEQLHSIKPGPDIEVAAFKPDGKIMLIDSANKVVHLNLGSDDRIYRGLTFSVYDKNTPIPKDGKGKAEIEVLKVEKNISVAQIIRSQITKPIVIEDPIANLIWDSKKTNVFAVAGVFDLDNDGNTDLNGPEKIKALIAKWGGQVADSISIDTDFLVLGTAPTVRRKPTFEEMETYPLAMERYENSLKKFAHYKEVINQAQALSIPTLNYERFLYLTGYKTLSTRPGAF